MGWLVGTFKPAAAPYAGIADEPKVLLGRFGCKPCKPFKPLAAPEGGDVELAAGVAG
jgi:hypothetical protein